MIKPLIIAFSFLALTLSLAQNEKKNANEPKKEEEKIIPAAILNTESAPEQITPQEIKNAYLKKVFESSIASGSIEAVNIMQRLEKIIHSEGVDASYKKWAIEQALLVCQSQIEKCREDEGVGTLYDFFTKGPDETKQAVWQYARQNTFCNFFLQALSFNKDSEYRREAAEELLGETCLKKEQGEIYHRRVLYDAPDDLLKKTAAEALLKSDDRADLAAIVVSSPDDSQRSKAWKRLINLPCEKSDCILFFSLIAERKDDTYGAMAKKILDRLRFQMDSLKINELNESDLIDLMAIVKDDR